MSCHRCVTFCMGPDRQAVDSQPKVAVDDASVRTLAAMTQRLARMTAASSLQRADARAALLIVKKMTIHICDDSVTFFSLRTSAAQKQALLNDNATMYRVMQNSTRQRALATNTAKLYNHLKSHHRAHFDKVTKTQ